jgi:hypothetical protein
VEGAKVYDCWEKKKEQKKRKKRGVKVKEGDESRVKETV